jgi:hypothetical protein
MLNPGRDSEDAKTDEEAVSLAMSPVAHVAPLTGRVPS